MDLEKTAEDAEGCELAEKNDEDGREEGAHLMNGSKKEPSVRRYELLVDSGLGESLIDTCIENAGELLGSNFGEVMYELAAFFGNHKALNEATTSWLRSQRVTVPTRNIYLKFPF